MVSIKGKPSTEPDTYLWDNYRIHTVAINRENISGLRVTSNAFNGTKEPGLLVEAFTKFACS